MDVVMVVGVWWRRYEGKCINLVVGRKLLVFLFWGNLLPSFLHFTVQLIIPKLIKLLLLLPLPINLLISYQACLYYNFIIIILLLIC